MAYELVGRGCWVWRGPGLACFAFQPGAVAPPVVSRELAVLGERSNDDLVSAFEAIRGKPNVTASLRDLACQFGGVTSRDFVAAAVTSGINPHTATKQFRLGRRGFTKP